MTEPLAVDIETANAIISRVSWQSNIMRDGKMIGQQVPVFEDIVAALTAVRKDYEEVIADHRRLVCELDVALHGEEGAAKQASLCDLIEPAKRLRADMLESAALAVRAACGMCKDGVADVIDGQPVECEYCGRPMVAIRALATGAKP